MPTFRRIFAVLAVTSSIAPLSQAFAPAATHSQQALVQRGPSLVTPAFGLTPLYAGFGGGKSDANKGKKKKDVKLKPKQQWDRYADFKTATKIRVAVKTGDADEWLEVGRVKSKEDAHTAIAVARQRAIIAEHGKRLYPLQVSAKKLLEWAYFDDAADQWNPVDKSVLDGDDVPAGIEKLVGFEGRPDPSTGFYCIYDDGKLRHENS